jgi:CubicO group peptidase (beta-lactamase class C family)
MHFRNGARRLIRRGLSLALALAAAPALAQPLPSGEEVAARADAYMDAIVAARGFGGSVLVARGDRILLSKGYGMADVEHKVPNKPETVFRIASISKPFTAAAILKLQERGRLGVEDLICTRLPECPPKWSAIRIRHLLDHSSGIPDFMKRREIYEKMREPRPPDEIARLMSELDLEFAPGTRTDYSNTNYQLLALLVDRFSGARYDAYLRSLVFAPLGMARTGPDVGEAVIPDRARGYRRRGGGIANADFVEMRLHRGSGGLLSTTGDLFRWSRALAAPGLFQQQSLDAMATATIGQYGFGWGVGSEFGRKLVDHSGLIAGFSTHLSRFPADDATVIVLMNNEAAAAPQIATMLSSVLFGHARPSAAMPQAALQDFPGTYRGRLGEVFVVTRSGDRLIGRGGENLPDALMAGEGGRLFMLLGGEDLEFSRDREGRVTGLTLNRAGEALRLTRTN